MAKAKYCYNPKTCDYELIRVSNWDVFFDSLSFLATSLVMATSIFWGTSYYLDSPKEARLKKENARLRLHYDQIQKEMEESHRVLARLQDRDDHIYRMVLEAEPLAKTIRRAGTGGTEQYASLSRTDQVIASTTQKVKQLKRELYIQAKSYEQVTKMAQDKANMLACVPAISPLSKKSRFYISSPYGIRPHPIHKLPKMHHGIDLAARRGTPVYATGDGVVKMARQGFTGYGNQVSIEHGYGFSTKYAHLKSFHVQKGQKVKRGQCIGYVGNSGTVTGVHLHYEVLKNNKSRNPAHYFMSDLDAAEYDVIVELASRKISTPQ